MAWHLTAVLQPRSGTKSSLLHALGVEIAAAAMNHEFDGNGEVMLAHKTIARHLVNGGLL